MAKLTRSNNKVIAGVCSGLAEHFGLSTSAMRIVFVLLLFLTFSAVGIAYIILMVIMKLLLDLKSLKMLTKNQLILSVVD